jgi:hypothetical protein
MTSSSFSVPSATTATRKEDHSRLECNALDLTGGDVWPHFSRHSTPGGESVCPLVSQNAKTESSEVKKERKGLSFKRKCRS